MFRNKKIVDISHDLIKKFVKEGDTVVDGTLGGGKDTLFLYNIVGEKGKVISFDIQELAIQLAKKFIKAELDQLPSNIEFINDSHSDIKKYVREEISCCVFNTGYLPQSPDKKITTTGDTTVVAIENVLDILSKDGAVIIVCYHGHDKGEEKNIIENFLSSLEKDKLVTKIDWINRKNNSPIIYVIENNK